MVYGGIKFSESVIDNENCTDVDNSEWNTEHNCTTIEVDKFPTFLLTAYTLYRITFGETTIDEVYNH